MDIYPHEGKALYSYFLLPKENIIEKFGRMVFLILTHIGKNRNVTLMYRIKHSSSIILFSPIQLRKC